MYIYFEHSVLIVILIFLRIHSLQHAASQSLAGEQSSKLLLQAVLSENTLARYSTLQGKGLITSVLTNWSSSVMNRETKHKNCHHPGFFDLWWRVHFMGNHVHNQAHMVLNLRWLLFLQQVVVYMMLQHNANIFALRT